ncbi:hypothetical protein PROFUN_08818 [Planoprotostelium fungivorum]|uniref:Uncharacterized protein n=1 Tax=Planoprotostelium fungivorum TaxID=1890364 RepID=A0A2P6MVU9_9EUKA|nr:hypothetical protein PROFUN_08818 [Planoprotostelium fungivorum]
MILRDISKLAPLTFAQYDILTSRQLLGEYVTRTYLKKTAENGSSGASSPVFSGVSCVKPSLPRRRRPVLQ